MDLIFLEYLRLKRINSLNLKKYDITIVGGGIVGLSTAYKIQLKYPKLNLLILEKEKKLASHQTGRNSGVLHSGLYYKPGSLKAKNCVEGRRELVQFAKQYNINFDVCGKLVVASDDDQSERLNFLKYNGEQNGLIGLKILDSKESKDIEPYVEAVKALWVPETGIIDYVSVTNMLSKLIISINPNSNILTSCKVLSFSDHSINTTKGVFTSKHIIFCGGLFSDRLAAKDKLHLDMQIVGFRGDYFKLRENAKFKVRNLIYPVPNPEFPFLGLHLTRMTNGDIECGPNAVFTFKREGYNKTDFNIRDTIQALLFSGTHKLFINHWKFGINEYKRAFSKSLFLKEIQKMVPSIRKEDIIESRSGVRAMALRKSGEIVDDFNIVKNGDNIHVLNAPSPAATACLAIGEQIMNKASIYFNM